tara:strand:- start:708 stop:1562 length:855 start_codon:yes stop_codon:yes gene_type:complete
MLKKKIIFFSKNIKILTLVFLTLITILISLYFSHQKNINNQKYKDFTNNFFFKKTLNEVINNLEPRFKTYDHKIKSGETFDIILQNYGIDKEEVKILKKSLSQKININKLNTNQTIQIILDQTNNKIKEFIFKISNTEKIFLVRNNDNLNFDEEILSIKLDKKILYKENVILQSLYKSASNENIPPNIIIEFARIYGFQVDFQRDIRKEDKFQIMYEVFINKEKEVIETGEILYANLKLSGQDNSLYFFNEVGSEGHYDKNGKSVQKALMKTPINGARLSSFLE